MSLAWNVAQWTPEFLWEYLDELERNDPQHELNWRCFEIVDGSLVVSPPPTPRHELVVSGLCAALWDAVPAGFRVIGSAAVRMARSYYVTDVTVLADQVFTSGQSVVEPGDVLLAVEVESPSSVTIDRITKPAHYAAAGITHLWRIETDPLRLHAYRRSSDGYESIGSWGAGETARLVEPFPVEIDLARLAPTALG